MRKKVPTMKPGMETAVPTAYINFAHVQESIEKLGKIIKQYIKEHWLSKKVLVLDDDPIMARVIAESIRRSLNVEAEYATTTSDAFLMWNKNRHAVIVVDILMPFDGDGFQFLSDIGRGPRAVIFTGRDITPSVAEAARMSNAKILQKGSERKITELVKELLDDAFPPSVD